jgi:endonuclease-3 related protein
MKSKDLLSKASLLKILRSAQDDDLVLVRERLLSLWGIGPETADTILLYGLDRPVFVVDAYTRRLLFKLTGDASWSKRQYDEVRRFCESTFTDPSVGNFQEAHALIVRWGKENR